MGIPVTDDEFSDWVKRIHHLSTQVDHLGLPDTWWDLRVPALNGKTPAQVAFIDIDAVERVVNSYFDPSYS